MRWLLMLCLPFALSGCLSMGEITSTGGASIGATVGTALGGPVAGLATGVIGGVVGGAAVKDMTYIIDPNQIDSFWQLAAYGWQQFAPNIIGIVAVVGALWLIAGFIGLRMKRPEEKKLDEHVSVLIEKIGKMKE